MYLALLYPALIAVITLSVPSVSFGALSEWTLATTLPNDDTKRVCGYYPTTKELFMLGGQAQSSILMSYNIESDTTTTYDDALQFPIQNSGQGADVFGQGLYFVKDHDIGLFNMDTRQVGFPIADSPSVTVYGKRACLAMTNDGKYLFILGGSRIEGTDGNQKVKQFTIYNRKENTIVNGPLMNEVRSSLTCNILGDYLYAIGGDTGGSGKLDSIERIDISDISNIGLKQWWYFASMNVEKNGIKSSVLNEAIYITGATGSDLTYIVERLDTHTGLVTVDKRYPHKAGIVPCQVTVDDRIYVVDGDKIYYTTILTSSPSKEPTTSPSRDPTTSPSTDPTTSPSKDPTTSPSTDPTTSPSTVPTTLPSTYPTRSPSTDPTTSPSTDPTTSPSPDPTTVPSLEPTTLPSSQPTTQPSTNPTTLPSTDPTTSPSTDPTTSPSTDPTISPSRNPTTSPSTDPTTSPSADPTISPSTTPPSTNPTPPPTGPPTVECFQQGPCDDGYMDKTDGDWIINWECGLNCEGAAGHAALDCTCACVEVGSCTTPVPTECFPRGPCKSGFMDRTDGTAIIEACGVLCVGSILGYTDGDCNCACIREGTCNPAAKKVDMNHMIDMNDFEYVDNVADHNEFEFEFGQLLSLKMFMVIIGVISMVVWCIYNLSKQWSKKRKYKMVANDSENELMMNDKDNNHV